MSVYNFKKNVFCLKIFSTLTKSVDTDAALCCISSGSSLFANILVLEFPEYKGLSRHMQLFSGVKSLNFSFILHSLLCDIVNVSSRARGSGETERLPNIF